MPRYRVSDTGAQVFLPGIGRVRAGQIVEVTGVDHLVGTLLVEVPEQQAREVLEAPKLKENYMEAPTVRVPLELPPVRAPYEEDSKRRRRR
jgi:hypothetical protein